MKGSLSEREPVVPRVLLLDLHSQISHVPRQVAADVHWSHLLVGKATRYQFQN